MMFSPPQRLSFPFLSQFTFYISFISHPEQYLFKEAFAYFPDQTCVCLCVSLSLPPPHAHACSHTHTIITSYLILFKCLSFVIFNTIAILPRFAWVFAKIAIDIKLHEYTKRLPDFAYSVFPVLRHVSECYIKEFSFYP